MVYVRRVEKWPSREVTWLRLITEEYFVWPLRLESNNMEDTRGSECRIRLHRLPYRRTSSRIPVTELQESINGCSKTLLDNFFSPWLCLMRTLDPFSRSMKWSEARINVGHCMRIFRPSLVMNDRDHRLVLLLPQALVASTVNTRIRHDEELKSSFRISNTGNTTCRVRIHARSLVFVFVSTRMVTDSTKVRVNNTIISP